MANKHRLTPARHKIPRNSAWAFSGVSSDIRLPPSSEPTEYTRLPTVSQYVSPSWNASNGRPVAVAPPGSLTGEKDTQSLLQYKSRSSVIARISRAPPSVPSVLSVLGITNTRNICPEMPPAGCHCGDCGSASAWYTPFSVPTHSVPPLSAMASTGIVVEPDCGRRTSCQLSRPVGRLHNPCAAT